MSDIENDVSDNQPAPDTSADDAKYAAMEAKYAGRDKGPETADSDSGGEEGEAQGDEAKVEARKPLAPEEVEKRWNDTKAALKETRREARELKADLDRLKAEREAQVEADPFEQLISSLRDDDDDPIEDIATLKRVIKSFQDRQKAETQAETATRQQETQFKNFLSSVAEAEAEFKEDTPDYDDAAAFLKKSVIDELSAEGLEGDDLAKAAWSKLSGIAKGAQDRGRNPAETAYNLAKLRGFKGGKTAEKTTDKIDDKIAATQADIDKAAEKIQTLKQGQQAGRSLSSVGGGNGTGGQVTLASAAKKSGKELLADYAKLKAQAKRSGNYR